MRASLQVNVAPPDLPHARHTLPHQMRVWSAQVDEIVFTYDTTRPSRGRFAATWEQHRPGMDALLAALCAEHPHARIAEVDPSPATVAAVARAFLAADHVPAKDSRGGPMYSYFFGLHDARSDLILHTDSDMLFGGGSQHWLAEAAALLAEHPDVLFAGPLPGPPHPRGVLPEQPVARPVAGLDNTHAFPTVTTRVFLVDRVRLRERLGPLPLLPPVLRRSRLKAAVNRHPPYAMPEQLISSAMAEHGALRVDLLGSDPGMWSLHPADRSPNFYAALPRVVDRVESGDMPPGQLGVYDVGSELVDWSDVVRPGPLRRLLT